MLLTYIVPSEMDGTLLHDVLRRGIGLSAKQCKDVKRTPGALLVDGQPMFANQRVREGMRVTVEIAEKTVSDRRDTQIEIIYEDDALVCVNKPSGIVCHPTRGLAQGEETLLERVNAYLGFEAHPVHRLDRGTSGLWLCAKNAFVQSRLLVMEKTYQAVCFGMPNPPQGTMNRPILTHPDSARRTIDPAGQRAVTHYETVQSGRGASLVRVRLETGRTHQIRVHFASIGCPLLGDSLYASAESQHKSAELGVQRLMLHACELRFDHPVTGETIALAQECPSFQRMIME